MDPKRCQGKQESHITKKESTEVLYLTITRSLTPWNLRFSIDRSRIAADISSSREETLTYASS
jgi:hypothetical protein